MKKIFALLLFIATAAVAAPPKVEDLFRLPQFAYMAISPDGEAIAALAPVAGRQNLVILDAKGQNPKAITAQQDSDIVAVQWLSSRRLLVTTGRLGTRDFDQRGGALYAIDRDGSEGRLISEGSGQFNGTRFVGRFLAVVRKLPGDGDDIIAEEIVVGIEGRHAGDLLRVNTRTGRRASISVGKPDSGESESWVVDNNGVARVQTVFSQGRVRIHYRAGPDDAWRKLDEFSQLSPGWKPLAIDADGKSIIVSDRRQRDRAAIVRYDPSTKSFGEVLAQHPRVDLEDLLFVDGRVAGVSYDADRPGVAWFDDKLAAMQRGIDKALPDTVNFMTVSRDASRAVIFSFSDQSPGSFYAFDANRGKLEWLVDRAPWIKPSDMAHMQPVRYTARDGLEIPAYLTLPPEGPRKGLPLVVVIHGGPWIEGDSWGFEPEAQFLASRGYAVLQPEFRGTTRYGWKHYAASFRQWGLAMQDDIADGVKWAVDEGIADPKRVCLYGASYGGYATMMGLAKHPELYRCGINYVGVTDLSLFLTATWADYAQSDFIRYNVKDLVGDASQDAEMLKRVSPVELAARIKAPVLMAYGASDRRVPIEHGTRMRSALESAGNTPTWIVAEGEGHGFREIANQKMFYEAMEKFLAKNLK